MHRAPGQRHNAVNIQIHSLGRTEPPPSGGERRMRHGLHAQTGRKQPPERAAPAQRAAPATGARHAAHRAHLPHLVVRRAEQRKLASKMRLPLTPTGRASAVDEPEADLLAQSCRATRACTRGQCRVQRAFLHWRYFLPHLGPDRAARCVADAI